MRSYLDFADKLMSTRSDQSIIKLITCGALAVASLLVISKAFVWHITGSLSIKASLVDSLLDACASFINFIAIYHALRPADAEHKFGHGKAEALASLGQSIFITFSAGWLLKEVVERIHTPHPVIFSLFAVYVMVGAVVLTLLLVIGQRYVINRTGSLAIEADSLHYQTDLFTNMGVLLSFFLSSYFSVAFFDTAVGALIAIYILYTSWKIAKKAFDILMDRELPDDVLEKITEIAKNHAQVLGIHDLKTRSSGQNEFIQMHLDLDKDLTLEIAHAIAEEVASEINRVFPKAEVIIHQDPIH